MSYAVDSAGTVHPLGSTTGELATRTVELDELDQAAEQAAAAVEAMAEHIAKRVTEHLAPGMTSAILSPYAAELLAAIADTGIWRQPLVRGRAALDLIAEVRPLADRLELTLLHPNNTRLWSGVLRLPDGN